MRTGKEHAKEEATKSKEKENLQTALGVMYGQAKSRLKKRLMYKITKYGMILGYNCLRNVRAAPVDRN